MNQQNIEEFTEKVQQQREELQKYREVHQSLLQKLDELRK